MMSASLKRLLGDDQAAHRHLARKSFSPPLLARQPLSTGRENFLPDIDSITTQRGCIPQDPPLSQILISLTKDTLRKAFRKAE
jgi:hypothetical protein